MQAVQAVQRVRALEAAERPTTTRTSRDWTGVREGAREVFLTVAATLAIGLAWAALELGRTGAEPAPAAASGFETGYDGTAWMER